MAFFSSAQKHSDQDWYLDIAGRARIMRIYDAQLEALSTPYKPLEIQTSYGRTRVFELGDPSNPPLMLVHGTNASAPAVLGPFEDLAAHFHLFAVDVIGQPNQSASTRPSMKDGSYGKWMNEVLSELEIGKVNLLGISFGGFICLNTAMVDQSRLNKVFLVVPGGIAMGSPFKMYSNAFVPMKKFKKTEEDRYFQQFMSASATDPGRLTMDYMKEVLLNYEIDTSPIPKMKKKKAAGISIPMYLVASQNDMFFPGEKVIKRAEKIFPSLQGTLLLSRSRHIPSSEDMEEVIRFIVERK